MNTCITNTCVFFWKWQDFARLKSKYFENCYTALRALSLISSFVSLARSNDVSLKKIILKVNLVRLEK
jgi:hypothetical protein